MTASAQGRDVSAYQPTLTPADLHGLDFAYVKATEGLSVTDTRFAANWAVLSAWGKPRGAYHEFVPRDSPASQAEHFVATVKPRAGDMLAVVASDYAGVTDAEILAFCDVTRTLAGPHCPVLVYTDLSVAKTLVASSQHYDLWVAWPSRTAPHPSQWAPAKWKTWRFWQWGETAGEDADAYNGGPADLAAWLKTYTGTASTVDSNQQEDDVTPAVAYWNGQKFHARVKNGTVQYMGPDTGFKWKTFEDSHAVGGVSLAISAAGEKTYCYQNAEAHTCQYVVGPGGTHPVWQDLGT
jgi:lysozyme